MKKSPLRKVSKNRAGQLRLYAKKRDQFLALQPWCEIGARGCTIKSKDVHHMKGRIGDMLLDRTWWAASCRSCHRFLHDNPKWAREKKWIQ